jgi:membrane protein DedA with SNARE-associated domain
MDAAVEEPGRRPPASNRMRLATLFIPISGFVIAGYTGTILFSKLVTSKPTLLIALNPRLRHLLLVVAAGIPAWSFFVVGFLALIAPDPLYFLLGRWYGEQGRTWMEENAGGLPFYVRWIEKAFDRAGVVLAFVMPSALVCLLAGSRRMSPRLFWTLDITGTIARLLLVWWLGNVLEGPLDVLLDWINRFQWPLVIVFFVIVMVQVSASSKRQAASIEEVIVRPEPDSDEATEGSSVTIDEQ